MPEPVARVESGWTGRYGNRCVRARCPYCLRLHIHGWPLEQDDVGGRSAHCGAGDYMVVDAGSAPHDDDRPAAQRAGGV
jgi:hypothetical protein